jgi:hypothetical protein
MDNINKEDFIKFQSEVNFIISTKLPEMSKEEYLIKQLKLTTEDDIKIYLIFNM